ncbi:Wadjet anti-phage system protein JetD domain-containing protein [Salinispora pacifica]|uniref:Wadjet anti-phage system protein JetD domain-containing protein n=1 Tax=Salinispora pacifica TaxID=351187 RepID=UPI000485D87E|nr:Wadjet anti-phage system protein JetD domain-containing protein [Salinispora pacifica]
MTGLSPLARHLAATVTAHRTARIPLGILRTAAHAADLSLAGDPDARRKLAGALDELTVAGIIRKPAAATRAAWDHTLQPPLPNWVQRPVAERPPTAGPATVTTTWHARLAWAATFVATERPTDNELALLHAANRYLAEHQPPEIVPMRERSWELLREEKALDTLSRGRLFAANRLTLADLHCERIPLPLVQWQIGDGPAALMVENHTTAHSLAHWLPADGSVGTVIWTGGSQLPQILASIPADWTRPLHYYGDLDLRGIEIAADGDHHSQALGLGPLTPASNLYRLLLDVGTPIKPRTRARLIAADHAILNWFPPDLRTPIGVIIAAGLRIPQEATGRSQLISIDPKDFDPCGVPTGSPSSPGVDRRNSPATQHGRAHS